MDELYQDDDDLLGLVDKINETATPSLRRGNYEGGYTQSYIEREPKWLAYTAAFCLLFVAAFVIRWIAYIICIGYSKMLLSNCEKRFDQLVSEARKEMDASRASASPEDSTPTVAFQSYDGDFYIKYEDCGKTRSGFVKIRLKNNGENGYEISGMCADADGYATITDGQVSYVGDAWWVQEILGEDEERAGLRVISRGKFDLSVRGANVFSGGWVANTGTQGCYLTFEAKHTNTITSDISISSVMPDQAVVTISIGETV